MFFNDRVTDFQMCTTNRTFQHCLQSIHIMLFKPESVQGLFRNSAFSFFALQFLCPKLIKTVYFTENITLFTENRDMRQDVTYSQVGEVLIQGWVA